ncbi:hypothetical protein [Dictyobacter aurantiacus]|uniref:Uncharacterized protein n=1 Tax=Dictyobacter aurantiacus TaxID=1936993 RepID=A0A401ZQP5_9CHLR|nr:hypothetical protein [Dictyobacter aurantiacus]GCE09195.1 hypothetical protein KDAU_65240 [Dictyobacter aurantiacus]
MPNTPIIQGPWLPQPQKQLCNISQYRAIIDQATVSIRESTVQIKEYTTFISESQGPYRTPFCRAVQHAIQSTSVALKPCSQQLEYPELLSTELKIQRYRFLAFYRTIEHLVDVLVFHIQNLSAVHVLQPQEAPQMRRQVIRELELLAHYLEMLPEILKILCDQGIFYT